MADNDEVGASDPNQVFILDMRRSDGSRFVTSTSTLGGIEGARQRHNGVSARVAHWKRDRPAYDTVDGLPSHWNDWRLAERFAL